MFITFCLLAVINLGVNLVMPLHFRFFLLDDLLLVGDVFVLRTDYGTLLKYTHHWQTS